MSIGAFASQAVGAGLEIGVGTAAVVGSSVLSPMITASTRGIAHISNATWPTVLPPPELLISAWAGSYIDPVTYGKVMVANGISMKGLDAAVGGINLAKLWEQCVESTFTKPGGIDVIRAGERYLITPGMADGLMKKYSYDVYAMEAMKDSLRDWMTPHEVLALNHRGYFTPQQFYLEMKHAGGYTKEVISAYKELATVIPGVSDLIHFAVREAFNEPMAGQLGLDEEFAESGKWKDWYQAQTGRYSTGYLPGIKDDVVDWAKMYWRSHWHLMSPQQSYEALHRLRPNRIHLYAGQVPDLKAFTFNDLNALLKANDYLPGHRKWLAALSFSTPRLVDLRKMWFGGTIDRNEFKEYLQDRGYTPTDAERTAAAYDYDKKWFSYKRRAYPIDKYDRKLYTELITAFRVGSIDDAQLRLALADLLGSDDAALATVNGEMIRLNAQIVKQFVATVKQQFMTGEILRMEAEQALIGGGVNAVRAEMYVRLWATSFDLPRKAATVAMLRQWYFAGVISDLEMDNRLHRLGYSNRDIALLMLDMRQKKNVKDEKEKGRRGGSGGAATNYRTPTVIAKWFNAGYLTEKQAKGMLAELNVPESDQDDWLGTAPPATEE